MQLRPSVALTLVLLPLAGLAVWLALWQLDRMNEKQDMFDQFENAPSLGLSEAVNDERAFAHVQASGQYETAWHLMLDNKMQDGRVGVHILSLFRPDQGVPILVNRGWLPLPPDRRNLPEFSTPSGHLVISGILNRPAEGGIQLGEPTRLDHLNGPLLITYLEMDEIERALGTDLSPWLIQLEARNDTGFGHRDWKPAVILPAQHRAYAVQWFALALAIVIIWLVLGWKRGQRPIDSISPDANRGAS